MNFEFWHENSRNLGGIITCEFERTRQVLNIYSYTSSLKILTHLHDKIGNQKICLGKVAVWHKTCLQNTLKVLQPDMMHNYLCSFLEDSYQLRFECILAKVSSNEHNSNFLVEFDYRTSSSLGMLGSRSPWNG